MVAARLVALRGGHLLACTVSGREVNQCLLRQPVLRCWMGPSVESSQNRLAISAVAPHWGQGMVSDMVRSYLVAVVNP